MKIEIEVTPEEMRALFGLPDARGLQQVFLERATDWMNQNPPGAELMQRWMEGVTAGGLRSLEAYQSFLDKLGAAAKPKS